MNKPFTIYLRWAFWVGVAFFSVYPSANWLTSQRNDLLPLYFPGELALPFVPQWIWIYLSMYVLFVLPPLFLTSEQLPQLGKQLIAGTIISGAIFLLFPASLGFDRVLPDTPPYNRVFAVIFQLDHPHNLVPSLHVVFSACIILALASKRGTWIYSLLMIWLTAILASTLLIHQHHLLDVISGLALTLILRNHYRSEPCSNA
jgi:membrane-associated phospholipid phosphatase